MRCMGPGTAGTSQLRRGVLEYCILAIVSRGDSYAFDIVRRLGEERNALVVSEGTIYPLLSRIRRDGLVSSDWKPSSDGPPRKYYRITAKGRTALAQFRGEWASFVEAVDAIVNSQGDR